MSSLKETALLTCNCGVALKADDGDVNVIIEGDKYIPEDKFDAAVKELCNDLGNLPWEYGDEERLKQVFGIVAKKFGVVPAKLLDGEELGTK